MKLHAHRQVTAGVHWRTIQKNQVRLFGERAPLMSERSIRRLAKPGALAHAARGCHRYCPGHSLTARHQRLLREMLEVNSEARTEELSSMLGQEERESDISSRTEFPASTIDDFVRDAEGNTVKVLTVYDPRRNAHESARCRSALRRYPVKTLLVIDACHVDTRKDSARRTGRSKKGSRAYARQFLSGDGKMRTVMGVMNMNGMVVEACGFMVRVCAQCNAAHIQSVPVSSSPSPAHEGSQVHKIRLRMTPPQFS
jgi:hypothetical protein